MLLRNKARKPTLPNPEWRPAAAIRGYLDFKPNGWPYCPRCDNDGLFSDYRLPDGDRRTEAERLSEYIRCIVGCYHCGWRAPELWRLKAK